MHNYDVQDVESIREVGLKKTNALLGQVYICPWHGRLSVDSKVHPSQSCDAVIPVVCKGKEHINRKVPVGWWPRSELVSRLKCLPVKSR